MAIFWGSSGKTYTLGNTPLATGGEGNIFVVQSEANRVAKIYHSVTSSLEKKITLMMKRPPSPSITNQLAWPLDVLRDQNGQFKGFVLMNSRWRLDCNGVQREHNKKLNNGLPILHKVPPKRDYGRYFCIMAEKGGTSHGGLTEKLSPFFHAKKQEVNAYGR